MQDYIKRFHIIRPFASALAVIVTTVALIFTIYFTERGQLWIQFLAGILVASVLAAVTRVSNTERVAKLRVEELENVKSKLNHEIQLRKSAEEVITASKPKLDLINEALPIMVVLIDTDGRCSYYNRSFIDWLHLQPQQIIGRHIREVLGAKIYREIATAVRQSLDGHPVLYERTQRMPDRIDHKLRVEHIPQFNEDGKITGFFMLIDDITLPSDAHMSYQIDCKGATDSNKDLNILDLSSDTKANQDAFVDDPFSGQTTEHDKDARRIMEAIENGEYCLFCQLIAPPEINSAETEHYEVLVRLIEEDKSIMSPGDFFPLAEMNGHMAHLDRWVVEHVTELASRQNSHDKNRKNPIYFINISDDSICNSDFPEFLKMTLQEHGVPGAVLCFEVEASGLVLRNADIAEFALQVNRCGCHVAISGFGRDRVLFDLMQGFKVDFIKIDGSITLNILQNPVDLATFIAIQKEAKKMGARTIAELVESEELIIKCKEIGVDFVQGYGISQPRPLV